MSNSSCPHELQHTRLLCPPLAPRVCSNSCPLSRRCHTTISSSAATFSFCLQSFPSSRSFPTSQLYSSDGQSIGASASASVFPVNIQGWFPLGLPGLISLPTKGHSWVFSSTTVWNQICLGLNASSPTIRGNFCILGEVKLLNLSAAAKSLQSCLTLCYPIDGIPPGSPIPGILQARTLEWVAILISLSLTNLLLTATLEVIKLLGHNWVAKKWVSFP